MAWTSNVVGGIGDPRVLLLSEDLVVNGSFEDVTAGVPDNWTAGDGPNVFAQLADTDSIYGDYVIDIDNAGGAPASDGYQQCVLPSGIINGKHILFIAYAKSIISSNDAVDIYIWDTAGAPVSMGFARTLNVDADSMSRYKQCGGLIQNMVSAAGSANFQVRIYPDLSDVNSRAYFDNVQVYEAEEVIDLPQPTQWDQRFVEEFDAQNELTNGVIARYSRGWRYRIDLFFEYFSKDNELNRQKIIDHNGPVAIQPHNDLNWFQVVQWTGSFKRQYFYDRFLAHTSSISLMGVELLDVKPQDIVT